MTKSHDKPKRASRVAEVPNPALHPALKIIGLADDPSKPEPGYDVAVEHDRLLAESEIALWQPPKKAKRGR